MSRYFPVFLNLEGRKAMLIGAGNIGCRRLERLLAFGANVHVVAPEISKTAWELAEKYPDQTCLEQRAYLPGEISGVDLVLSATDSPDIDTQIYEECRAKHIPVNIAADQSKCDFYFPAIVEYDGLVIGVTSGGSDHHKVRRFSAWLRQALAKKEDGA